LTDLDDGPGRQLGGIRGRRPHVLDAERRIACDDLLRAQPGRQIVEHDSDRNPRALDAGLAVADGRVGADTLTPIPWRDLHAGLVTVLAACSGEGTLGPAPFV